MGEASIAVAVICRFSDEIRKDLVKKLEGGDVVDRWLLDKIESDLDRIKRELKGIKRNDLLSGISNYKQGILLTKFSTVPVSEVDGPKRTGSKEDDIPKLLTAKMNQTAKERFKKAREETHRAFNNESLSVQDRIQATKFCVKAQILESDDNPTEALTLCKGYLEEMHNLEEVQNNFALEVDPGKKLHKAMKQKLKTPDRRKLISSVCEVNRIVFDIAQLVADDDRQLFIWPCVKIHCEKEEIDPLRDPRLRGALLEQNTKEEECFVVRSFGHQMLKLPHSIATTCQGEFIVADGTIPVVFGNSGEHLYHLKLPIDETIQHDIVDVDTDQDSKVYLLVEMKGIKEYTQKQWFEVFVFDKQDMHTRFKLQEESIGRKLAVNARRDTEIEVLILEGGKGVHARVEVYGIHGQFIEHFNGRILDDAQDIVAASDGHVFVLDSYGGVKCVREFSAKRKHLRSFGVDPHSVAITYDRASGHIVTVSAEYDDKQHVFFEHLSIYDDKDSSEDHYSIKRSPVRPMKLDELASSLKQNIAVTTRGRIAVVLQDNKKQGKVVVV